MKSSFLLTRPNYELTTRYLFAWAEKIVAKAKEQKIFTIDLSGIDANKNKFTKKVKRFNPGFIYLNGHGSANSVTGYDNEPLLKFADNEKLTKDKVVYALSCQSAKRLGKACVSFGAKTYLGYDEDFIFVFDEEKQNDPVNDKTAEVFLAPSNDLVSSVLDGKTTGGSFDNSQENFNQNIVNCSLSDATAEERELLPYLLWDREHQVCLGNKEEKCEFVSKEEYYKKRRVKIIILTVTILVMIIYFYGRYG